MADVAEDEPLFILSDEDADDDASILNKRLKRKKENSALAAGGSQKMEERGEVKKKKKKKKQKKQESEVPKNFSSFLDEQVARADEYKLDEDNANDAFGAGFDEFDVKKEEEPGKRELPRREEPSLILLERQIVSEHQREKGKLVPLEEDSIVVIKFREELDLLPKDLNDIADEEERCKAENMRKAWTLYQQLLPKAQAERQKSTLTTSTSCFTSFVDDMAEEGDDDEDDEHYHTSKFSKMIGSSAAREAALIDQEEPSVNDQLDFNDGFLQRDEDAIEYMDEDDDDMIIWETMNLQELQEEQESDAKKLKALKRKAQQTAKRLGEQEDNIATMETKRAKLERFIARKRVEKPPMVKEEEQKEEEEEEIEEEEGESSEDRLLGELMKSQKK